MKNRRHGRNHLHIITLILRRRTDSPVLLGLIVGVIGDMLLAVFYIYGAIVWVIFILEFIIPLSITISAVLIEHIVYPFRWLNNYLLRAEKPEFDFLKIKQWPYPSPIDYI